MPYVIRDEKGGIVRATVQPIHGSEMLPYDHPDLVAFLERNGQDPKNIDKALSDLRRTDAEMSRAVEDVIMALLKKNILKINDLPKPVQERMSYRVKLRLLIQESFEKASGRQSDASFSAMVSPQE